MRVVVLTGLLLLLTACGQPADTAADADTDLESVSGSSEEDRSQPTVSLEPGERPRLDPVLPGAIDGARRIPNAGFDPHRALSDEDVTKWVGYTNAMLDDLGAAPAADAATRGAYEIAKSELLAKYGLSDQERAMISGRLTTALKYLEREGSITVPDAKKPDLELTRKHRKAVEGVLTRYRSTVVQ